MFRSGADTTAVHWRGFAREFAAPRDFASGALQTFIWRMAWRLGNVQVRSLGIAVAIAPPNEWSRALAPPAAANTTLSRHGCETPIKSAPSSPTTPLTSSRHSIRRTRRASSRRRTGETARPNSSPCTSAVCHRWPKQAAGVDRDFGGPEHRRSVPTTHAAGGHRASRPCRRPPRTWSSLEIMYDPNVLTSPPTS